MAICALLALLLCQILSPAEALSGFSNTTVIMMVGLQGAGKTTHSGKIAKYFQSKGKHPLLVACDVYRPAAIDQLKIVGESIGVPVFSMGSKVSPVEIARAGVEHAKKNGLDMVFIDTAGRLPIDEEHQIYAG